MKAWWVGAPTATVTMRNFTLARDGFVGRKASGYAYRNDPHSIVIYNGLNPNVSSSSTPATWNYVNATIHELGHGLFGFTHTAKGFTNDPTSIMDYRSNYLRVRNVNFNAAERKIILKSKWGQ